MRKFIKTTCMLVLSLLILSSCTAAIPGNPPSPSVPAQGENQDAKQILRVMTHDSYDVSESLVKEFQDKHNVEIQFLKSGDVGTSLNKAILSKGNPLADVFYGVDNTFLGRALKEGIFIPYASAGIDSIPQELLIDPQMNVLPVDYGDVCLNYDKKYFDEKKLQPPAKLDDLTKPDYKSLLVIQNPATSSPGLTFLLTSIGHFGEKGYLDFWKALKANDLKVVNDWETAYYTEFSRYGGTRPITVSYSSSPAYEIIGADKPVDEPLTVAVTNDDTCFRQIEFVGILNGTKKLKLAQAWIDFMLSQKYQEDIPGKLYMLPSNSKASLDPVFKKYLSIPQKPVYIDPKTIEQNRELWIKAWTETVLR